MMLSARSIGGKVLGLAAIITAVVFTAIVSIGYFRQRDAVIQRISSNGSVVSGMLALALDSAMVTGDRDQMRAQFQQAKKLNQSIGLHLLDRAGKIKFSTDPRLENTSIGAMDAPAAMKAKAAASLTGRHEDSGLLDLGGKRSFFQVRSITNEARCQGCHDPGQGILGSLVITQDMSGDWSAMQAQNLLLCGLSLAGLVVLVAALGRLIHHHVTRPLAGFKSVLERVAQGDLTVKATTGSRDEIGLLGATLNHALERLRESLQEVARASGSVGSGACQLSASAEQMSATTTQIAKSGKLLQNATDTVAAATLQFLANVEQVSGIVNASVGHAEEAVSATEAGTQGSREAGAAMVRIREATANISRVIGVIQEIAQQTNLLSLNAAIEAAKAGQHGIGFAVVADEVRKLAERSRQATVEIEKLLSDTHQAVQGGVSSVETTTGLMGTIQNTMHNVARRVREIGQATREQSGTGGEIARNMEESAREVGQNAAATEQLSTTVSEVSRTAAELARVSETMAFAVAKFQI